MRVSKVIRGGGTIVSEYGGVYKHLKLNKITHFNGAEHSVEIQMCKGKVNTMNLEFIHESNTCSLFY